MGAKVFLDSSTKFIPQMDFAVQQTENGGIEATQTFLCRSTSLGTADLTPFRRGTRAETLWPEVPTIYSGLRVKTAIPNQSAAAGIWEVRVVFTGTLFAWSTSGSSSGTEQTVPTYSLQGNLEEAPINEHRKWIALDDDAKGRLGMLLDGTTSFDISAGDYVKPDAALASVPLVGSILSMFTSVTPTGDELKFARLIALGKTTFKKPAWTYTVREESRTGFTTAQLSKLGKFANPPGDPPDPGSGWKWMLTGPNQEQSGESRFIKDTTFLLIEDNDDNDFLYTD